MKNEAAKINHVMNHPFAAEGAVVPGGRQTGFEGAEVVMLNCIVLSELTST